MPKKDVYNSYTRIHLVLIDVRQAGTAVGVSYMIGATPAGNLTVRLYQIAAEDTALNGTLLASSVSTAQAGTSQRSQLVLFQSSVVIQPGWEADNTTLNFMRMSNVYGPVDGCYQFIDQTYGALPSTITSLTSTANPNSVPAVWLKMT